MTVKARLRMLAARGIVATILQHGDDWGGALMLQLNLLDGRNRLYTQVRDLDGNIAWLALEKGRDFTETEAKDRIEKAAARDRDLWVIEIEDRQGEIPFEGKIL
jgi:GMP synthase (glutamine-hydrolysing)